MLSFTVEDKQTNTHTPPAERQQDWYRKVQEKHDVPDGNKVAALSKHITYQTKFSSTSGAKGNTHTGRSKINNPTPMGC